MEVEMKNVGKEIESCMRRRRKKKFEFEVIQMKIGHDSCDE
jgi:hypothetical protein